MQKPSKFYIKPHNNNNPLDHTPIAFFSFELINVDEGEIEDDEDRKEEDEERKSKFFNLKFC
ncbi:hypothetical protein MTR_5g037290 [Medicago truncatula]|uniref:Uncharacterized protein n=1 Tax=Medicago truncatula TaxID=3880 RepID=G7K898_MEDTR|nr:hypothetical protein MTR_5g037290 [Medicago truncatula]